MSGQDLLSQIPKSVQISALVFLLQRLRKKSALSATAATFGFLCMHDAFQADQVEQRLATSGPISGGGGVGGGKQMQEEETSVGFLPGFVGGCVAAAVEPSIASPQWIVWLLIRAARYTLPPVTGGEYITGSLAAGYNLVAYLWDWHELVPSYALFLSKCGGSNGYGLEAISKIRLDSGAERVHKFCHIIHPETRFCSLFVLRTLIRGMLFGASVHIPLHVLWHFSRTGKHGTFSSESVMSSLRSLAHAVAFLGAYPATAFAIICGWWKLTGRSSEARGTLTALGLLVGVSLIVESPARRKEVAAFTFTHALISFFGLARTKGGNLVSILLFGFAVGAVIRQDAIPGLLKWAITRKRLQSNNGADKTQ